MSISLPNSLKIWCQCGNLKLDSRDKCSNCQKIALPLNKTDKKARYRMLVKQGSITMQQARQEYRRYLRWLK